MRQKISSVPQSLAAVARISSVASSHNLKPETAADRNYSSPALAPVAKLSDASNLPVAEQLPFLARTSRELDLLADPLSDALWCYQRPIGRPSFTPTILRELIEVRQAIQRLFAARKPIEPAPFRYFVGGSHMPGIYNLGGDFNLLIRCIRTGDRDSLLRYAHDCIDVAFQMYTSFDLPITTIALVQGDALGGGFEGALSFNVLVAERGAKFGLPEILFNLFPGMGAYSFLSRKLDGARAERMILSGRIYGAPELHEMGLIDVLAEDGQGETAVRDYIARNRRKQTVHHSIYDVRRRVHPLTFAELSDITKIWVETALRLEEADLRKMERLMSAQLKRLGLSSGPIAPR
jgi:DSF synthase